ncbi:MAG: hypothetical protein HYZ28_23870 [Myxococcales bacterium]|nr:hypothetical protein [Myxococcales bacterium]
MRRLLPIALAVALFSATEAQAQFANRSLGASLGYMRFNGDQPFDWAIPLGLESSLYVENHFDLTARVLLMLITERIEARQIVAAQTNLGVRYLFAEESLRPYAGAELAFLYIFRNDGLQPAFFGIGPNLGIDYFAGDTVSVGARGFVYLYLMLNQRVWNSYGAQAVVATYF